MTVDLSYLSLRIPTRVERFLKTSRVIHVLIADRVFGLNPRIRWVALSTKDGSVVFSQMREGVDSHTTDSEDRAFMQLGPLLMTGVAERLSPEGKAGNLECVIACFEKDCVLLAKVRDGHLAISVDKPDALQVFEEILPQIPKLAI